MHPGSSRGLRPLDLVEHPQCLGTVGVLLLSELFEVNSLNMWSMFQLWYRVLNLVMC